MKRIENAEAEIEKDLEKTFSVQTKVTLDWEYSSAASERTGTDIQITKVEIRAEEEIEEGLLSEIGRHIFENYGCEVEFV
jgi:transcriptional regulator CtsR